MEPIQAQMVFCCAEQWLDGFFYRVEPWGDGLRLDPERSSTGLYCLAAVDSGEKGFRWGRAAGYRSADLRQGRRHPPLGGLARSGPRNP